MENILFKNSYARKLAIYDHLNECLIIANKIKEKKNSIETGEESYSLKCLEEHYEKELTDLFILLYFELDPTLIKERLEKFERKAKENV